MQHIGIIGGGPAGLFMFKRIVEAKQTPVKVTIFEKKGELGSGMPYSYDGAGPEHVTNVSGNEVPEIVNSLSEWIATADTGLLEKFNITPESFNDYKVIPRLLFGSYLADQFQLLEKIASKTGIVTEMLTNILVTDIEDFPEKRKVKVSTGNGQTFEFDCVVICTGHTWPKKYEGKVKGWFDSPYPPSKLARITNYPVAIKGASLTAIDAVRTLARENGSFSKNDDGTLSYHLNRDSPRFRVALHSINGLLPDIRFHLEDSHLSTGAALPPQEVLAVMEANDGFIPLNYIFERNFKKPLQKVNPALYEVLKDMNMEACVDHLMNLRERLDAMVLFKAEYVEAEKSIRRQQSVYWKEMLASLSYAINYPAKHLSAEDMLRLRATLMPLISIIIAFVPQSSSRELLALYEAGVLSVIAVDEESKVEAVDGAGASYTWKDENGVMQRQFYNMFIDAVGQAPVLFKDFPFDGIKKSGTVSEAFLRFRDAVSGERAIAEGNQLVKQTSPGNFYLQVPGININDQFQVLDKYSVFNNRIYVMAVPFVAGLNPDYSGLDFCEAASARIAKAMFDVVEKPVVISSDGSLFKDQG